MRQVCNKTKTTCTNVKANYLTLTAKHLEEMKEKSAKMSDAELIKAYYRGRKIRFPKQKGRFIREEQTALDALKRK